LNKKNNISKILVVGQTPPPFGGQAIIINKIINANYRNIKIYHIRMSFSKEVSQIGSFNFYKIYHLFEIIFKIYLMKIKFKINTMLYPPSGPDRNPILRDIVILLATRWLFKKIIFQFFAGGLSEYYNNTTKIEKFLMKTVYSNADITLRPSIFSPNDGIVFNSHKDIILPWGVDDNFNIQLRQKKNIVNILFVGVLRVSKGVMVLLSACRMLKLSNVEFELNILGDYYSEEIKKRISKYLFENELIDYINFHGIKTGNSYYKYFYEADIFCFPTFFESENLPIVLLDALKFGLPIVSTNWRSIPSIVDNSVNGFLVEIKNEQLVFEKLKLLIDNYALRIKMGDESRKMFLKKYDIKIFINELEKILEV